MLGDAGRHGNQHALATAFMDSDGAYMPKVVENLVVHFDEQDIPMDIPPGPPATSVNYYFPVPHFYFPWFTLCFLMFVLNGVQFWI